MPNWCENQTFIQGDEETIQRIIDDMQLPANARAELDETGDTYGENGFDNSSWDGFISTLLPLSGENTLENQYDQWGTKWGDAETSVAVLGDGDTLMLTYATPWGPADIALRRIAERYGVRLHNQWNEPGMMSMGFYTAETVDGEFLEDSDTYEIPAGQIDYSADDWFIRLHDIIVAEWQKSKPQWLLEGVSL